MPTVWSPLYYAAPLTPGGRDDDWCIDAVSRPPEVLFNFRKVPVETAITDLRDGGPQPELDAAGFERVVAPTRVDQRALADGSASALERYERETGELLRSRTGADAVLFFDATLRREDTDTPRDPAHQSAHQRVHVDQSPRSAWARAADHGGPRRRFQIVNVWRPLLAPVRNFPLTMCDYRSVDPAADLVVTRLDFPAWLKDRENYSVKHNPGHRWHDWDSLTRQARSPRRAPRPAGHCWYYWDSFTPDEVVLFKCYDSASRGLALAAGDTGDTGDRDLAAVAGLCPHTAFFDENGPTTGRLRVSLELRALLFYD